MREIYLLCNQFLMIGGMETYGRPGFEYTIEDKEAKYLVEHGLAQYTKDEENVKRKKNIKPSVGRPSSGRKDLPKNRQRARRQPNRVNDTSGDS